jgi:hypothetical protein
MKLRTAKAIDRSVLMTGTVGLAGQSSRLPSAYFWDTVVGRQPYVTIVMLVLVGVFGALSPVEALSARARADNELNVRKHILAGFGQIVDIAKQVDPPLDINDLALHIWRIRRTLRHPDGGVLARVATYRLGVTPPNRPFTPPKGVGVVGLCWKRDEETEMDVTALSQLHDSASKYRSYVERHGGDAVMNLTWVEFNRLKHRGAVFAHPIRNGHNRFVGCVSVDASRGYVELSGTRLQREMGMLCLVVAQTGFESY